MTTMPNPFEFTPEQSRFVLDEEAFMIALGDPPPVFLTDPSPEFLSATDLLPIVEILVAHR
jgi:hypothetical protein